MKINKYIYIVFYLVLLSGCATTQDLESDGTVTIKRVNSKYAYIKSVSIKQFDKEVVLAGVVKLRRSGRGTVRDHVEVRLTALNGDVVYMQEVSYHRLITKNGKANFKITFNQVPQPGSLLQLSLHDPSTHTEDI
jgi:hypothetical protein